MTHPRNIQAYDHIARVLQEASDRDGLHYHLESTTQAERWRNLAYNYRRLTGRYRNLILTLAGSTVVIRNRLQGRATDFAGRDIHV